MWSFYYLLIGAFCFFFYKFAKEPYFQKKYRDNVTQKEKIDYAAGFQLVKFDLLMIVLSMAFHLAIYPGVFYSLSVRIPAHPSAEA